MVFCTTNASDSFTKDIPPPAAAGDTPVATFPVMMLFLIVGVRAANKAIPPPLPESQLLFRIIFPMTCADAAPPIAIPPHRQVPHCNASVSCFGWYFPKSEATRSSQKSRRLLRRRYFAE